MNFRKRVSINLASEPVRNRRLYVCLLVFVLLVTLGVGLWSGLRLVRFQTQGASLRKERARLLAAAEAAKREEEKYARLIRSAEREEKERVESVNDIILRKSFSWIAFLSALEEALPGSSQILALTPTPAGGAAVEVRLTAVFRGLDEMVSFINGLDGRHFKRVRLISEDKDEAGRLLAEVSLVYE